MMRPGESAGNGIAVFPFLRTSDEIQLGSLAFRSTADVATLSPEDASHLQEVVDMLYLQDDLRVESAVYALLPPINFLEPPNVLGELEDIHTIIAYLYGGPRPTTGDAMFDAEVTSVAIFSPHPVSIFLLQPEHRVRRDFVNTTLPQDQYHRVQGYEGRYNFRHPFWATRGSRVYPSVPHLVLNNGQNLALDIDQALRTPQHQMLLSLLRQPQTDVATRTLLAMKWYNRASNAECDEDAAILSLGVAFETLLHLPKGPGKTARFIENVSLLLGNIDRLEHWAEQFYQARSEVVHEGTTLHPRYSPPSAKASTTEQGYRPLLSYGRQIFRLCVGGLLFGAQLGDRAGLHDQFFTNQERLQSVCKTMNDGGLDAQGRFAAVLGMLRTTERSRFFPETLPISVLVGAVQAAARSLLLCHLALDSELSDQVTAVADANRSSDYFEALTAIRNLAESKAECPSEFDGPVAITQRLAKLVWEYTFLHFFWLQEQHKADPSTLA